MINNSKILTVSYGTFSCTLEGFDDSFGTMKAIAEYFRDLAADDRYFGAEPPTPDAEMLARIAEREIARRVQAHEDGGKIVLRASEPTAPAALQADPVEQAPQAEAPAPAPAAPAEAPRFTAPMPAPGAPIAEPVAEQPAPAAAQPFAPADQPTEQTAEQTQAEDAAEEAVSDADFTANIAALTAKDEAEATDAQAEVDVEDAQSEPEEAETPEAEVADAEEPTDEIYTEMAEADMPAADSLADEAGDDASDMPAALAEDMPETAAEPIMPEPVQAFEKTEEITHPDPDSVAAKLRRIRSVVAQSEQGYGDTEYTEDEHAQDFLDDTAADLDAALAVDDAAELSAASAEEEAAARDAAEAEAAKAMFANIAAQAEAEAEAEAELEAEVEAELETEVEAEVEAELEPEAEPAAPETLIEEAEEDSTVEDTLAQLLADAMPEDTDEEGDEDTAEAEDDIDNVAERPLDARVVKMKRSVLEEAMASGELAEEETAATETGEDTVNLFTDEAGDDIENALSPEEEAELQRELAQVEADFASDADMQDEDDLAAETEDQPEAAAELDDDDDDMLDVAEDDLQEALDDASTTAARGVDRLQAVEKTSDVSRIFEQADSQLDAPDSSARRTAIQHLRAAVAATRADQNAGVDISNDKDDSAYRSDLADMVRPRRPSASGSHRSERPGMERPAPLKLVAEQRIDTPRDPVQPRRIRTSDIAEEAMEAVGDGAGGFAEFAEEMGAGSLPELLEAAAAYMADVEGRPQFSRPMLMGKLKEVEGESFSREDGLRSFGQLLRQGKLQKLQGGRFAVTDETEFRAETRNAG
ncbi:hypothetical protein EI983_01550 [Roseovarius faecimaris]|uniref:Chemotaxis protein CheA n=1 Tax=Roseovarius faecimaris TaxID=2494550 RepID=A0A6I6IJN5_9RHOB|nr:hypothetical protein [Roseovarius faecimaris]QGX97029.1 hypothetical protein EI983_01550 [Roseovarius faecimaris]